jgi:hypothetical protein
MRCILSCVAVYSRQRGWGGTYLAPDGVDVGADHLVLLEDEGHPVPPEGEDARRDCVSGLGWARDAYWSG